VKTYRCDGCRTIVEQPCIQIERIDGFSGGNVRFNPGRAQHFCRKCAMAISDAVGGIAKKGLFS
jgi:hypothetical protein